jgi:hypothetical protein
VTLPFDPAQIKIDRPPFSVFEILRKIGQGAITLNPDFQRNVVWDATQQSRLIESLLLHIPLPSFYLDARDTTNRQVIDGLQRLTALLNFCQKKTLRLQGLELLSDLNGLTFDDLTPEQRTTIEDTKLTIIEIQAGTPEQVTFHIYQRINTGGLYLNNQEIRHALYLGKASQWLKQQAETEIFALATNNQVDDTRMQARECVLRFIAFRLYDYQKAFADAGVHSFDELLNRSMQELNSMSDAQLDQYANDLADSLRKVYALFDELAFREVRENQPTGPFNKALFEIWTNLLTRYPIATLETDPVKTALQEGSLELMTNDAAFFAAIQPNADTQEQIAYRFGVVSSLIQSVLT